MLRSPGAAQGQNGAVHARRVHNDRYLGKALVSPDQADLPQQTVVFDPLPAGREVRIAKAGAVRRVLQQIPTEDLLEMAWAIAGLKHDESRVPSDFAAELRVV